MGCILYELAVGHRAFENDYAILVHTWSATPLEVQLDEFLSDECKATITKNIGITLQVDSSLRPSAKTLSEEFSRNFNPTRAQALAFTEMHSVLRKIHRTGSDTLARSLEGNDRKFE